MTVVSPTAASLHPARSADRTVTPEDLWAIPRVGNPVVSKDGKRIAVTVTTYDTETNKGTGRIWLMDASGQNARAMTSADHSSGEPAFSPDGRQIAFTRKGENGKPQLHVLPLDGGEARKLVDMPLGAFDPQWLPDGSGIVFGAKLIKGHLTIDATKTEIERREKDPVKAYVTEDRVYRFWDTWLSTGEVPHLFVYDVATGEVRDLIPDSTHWFSFMEPSGQFDISPDGKEITYGAMVFDEEHSLLHSSVFVVGIDGSGHECLTEGHRAGASRPRWSPDGRSIVFGMQHDPFFYADRMRLVSHERATGKRTALTEDWNLSAGAWTFARDGSLFIEAEEEARISVFRLEGAGVPDRIVRGGAAGCVRMLGDRIVFNFTTLAAPGELYTCKPDGTDLAALTSFTEESTRGFATGEVREMTFEGSKGEQVQMFIVLPPSYEEGKRYPLIQVVHGGPHGISGDSFFYRWNAHAFAAPGYVIALVNFQGSTSWGQDFAKRIQGGWGDRPFEDVMKATDALVAAGYADEDRMAAAGGSYGGYMAAWIEGHTNRFKCIVNHAGVFDLGGMYASDVTQGRAQSLGGEPWKDIEKIDAWDPSRHVKAYETPMLVIHGEKDYRVPVTQGLECYGVLKAMGIPARLVYFPDENHWVLKPRNSLFWYGEVMGWFERWLGKA